MKNYICVRKCFYDNVLYQEGQTATFGHNEKIPRHFKLAQKQPEQVIETDVEKLEKQKIDELRKILESNKRTYDRRWGSEKLQIEVDKLGEDILKGQKFQTGPVPEGA